MIVRLRRQQTLQNRVRNKRRQSPNSFAAAQKHRRRIRISKLRVAEKFRIAESLQRDGEHFVHFVMVDAQFLQIEVGVGDATEDGEDAGFEFGDD